MKQLVQNRNPAASLLPATIADSAAERHKPLVTRFGDVIDVRNRGALRVSRFAGSQIRQQDAPAVVRLWNDEQCREMSTHEARMLAAQLLAAALLAETQNSH